MNGNKQSLFDYINKAEGNNIKIVLYDKHDEEYKEANLATFSQSWMDSVPRNFTIDDTDIYLTVFEQEEEE